MAVVAGGSVSVPTYWPRERVLVLYANDPVLYHARWVLSRHHDGKNTLLTPDREVYDGNLNDKSIYAEVFRWPGTAMPDKKIKKALVYDDKLAGSGPYTQAVLESFYDRYHEKDAQGLVVAQQQHTATARSPTYRLVGKSRVVSQGPGDGLVPGGAGVSL